MLEAYQRRFKYLLVDEYQDTNHAQYVLTQLLAAKHKNIMVVGDDDQSIYSWRGADLRNILDFEKDYPDAHVVKLAGETHRSTGNILAAANAVIANNLNRKRKTLYTSKEDGEKISVYMASDERDEGRWIASEIAKCHGQGTSYNQIAVFYRTNAQSRMLEEMPPRAGVPYRLVAGTRFPIAKKFAMLSRISILLLILQTILQHSASLMCHVVALAKQRSSISIMLHV